MGSSTFGELLSTLVGVYSGPAGIVHGKVRANGASQEEMACWCISTTSWIPGTRGGLSGNAECLSRMAGKSHTFDSKLQPMRTGYKLDDIAVKCRQHPTKLHAHPYLNVVMIQPTGDRNVSSRIAQVAKFIATAEQWGSPVGDLKPAQPCKPAYVFGKIWASPTDKARFVQGLR